VNGLESERLVAWTLRVGAYGSFGLLTLAAILRVADQHSLALWMARAGILVLLATPTVRIIAALVMFAHQRDWKMVWVSTGVLLIVVLASLSGMSLH
jgi:uncharacterized membrane protein